MTSQITRFLRQASIRRKLRGMTLLTCAATLTLACAVLFAFELSRFRSALEAEMNSLADVVASTSAAALEAEDADTAREILAALRADPRVVAALLVLPTGRQLATFQRSGQRPAVEQVLRGGDGWLRPQVRLERQIAADDRPLGSLLLLGQMPDFGERAARYLLVVLVVLLLSLVAASVLSRWLEGFISRPLQRLAHLAGEVSAQGDYSLRAEPASEADPDEIGSLVARFNDMLEQIRQRDQALSKANQQLEDRVRERTRDLEEAKIAAEAASRAKSQFLANMSHELRTPLVGVIGYAGLLQATELDTTQKDYAHNITRSGEALVTLVDEILDFSRIESNRITLLPETFALAGLVDEVIQLLAPRADKKRIRLEAKLAQDVPATLHADPTRLRQVLINLLGNAVKFTETGSIRLRVARLPRNLADVWLRFLVQDTGIGIPASALPTLFDPFTQVDSSNTRRYGGAGLGLAISRRIVETMGGTLEVDSTEGVGSSFWFDVPVGPEMAAAGSCDGSTIQYNAVDST